MLFCWHKWSKWITFREARDEDFGTPIVYQVKTCEKCGKSKIASRT